MTNYKKVHFEISERKLLLRLLDIAFVLLFLNIIGSFFHLDYFQYGISNYSEIIVLAFYLLLTGTIFEMYDLQVASNRSQILRSILLTSSITALLFLLTPYFTPTLPSNRLQIVYFFS